MRCAFLCSPLLQRLFIVLLFLPYRVYSTRSRDHISDGVVIFPSPFFSFFDFFRRTQS